MNEMLNRIEHNKNALKTKRYYVEDLISNEELILLVEEIRNKDKVITKLLKRIAILEREVEEHEGF